MEREEAQAKQSAIEVVFKAAPPVTTCPPAHGEVWLVVFMRNAIPIV